MSKLKYLSRASANSRKLGKERLGTDRDAEHERLPFSSLAEDKRRSRATPDDGTEKCSLPVEESFRAVEQLPQTGAWESAMPPPSLDWWPHWPGLAPTAVGVLSS
ncbi:hypothetical protein MRX96_013274 [Rhipicephalus microplus]